MYQKLKMLPIHLYPRDEATEDDPLPLYYVPFFGRLYRERVELCLNSLRPGDRLLEVGYGSGISFMNLAGMYQQIYGIDIHTHARVVTDAFDAQGIRTHLCTGSLLELPYQEEYFDAVLCISILEHLQPEQQALAMQEVKRVLKPGGRFVYGVPAERPLMQFGFRLLGYDIRQFHFSTERDVSQAADIYLKRIKVHQYKPFEPLGGKVYEVGVYERPA